MEEQPLQLGRGGPLISSPLGMGLWSWGDSMVSHWQPRAAQLPLLEGLPRSSPGALL